MEEQITLTKTELIEVYKRWDADYLENYPTATIKPGDEVGQADEFLKHLKEIREK